MQCESGSGQCRKFKFSKKIRKRSVKPVLATIGSLIFQKKIQKSGVKPVPIAIGSVSLKKIRKPVWNRFGTLSGV